MKASLDILRGELERLFSTTGLQELCIDYLNVDPTESELVDGSKAVFVRRIVDWCNDKHAVEALSDAVMVLKKGMTDPRLKQTLQSNFDHQLSGGHVIGDFTVGDEIGKDGVSVSFECSKKDNEDAEKKYVFRIIHNEHSSNPSSVQRFLMAMRIMKGFSSSAMQKIVDCGMLDDGRPFVICEKASGETLASLKPLVLMDALSIFEAVIDALEEIHGMGLVHADLRTENVLLLDSNDDADEKKVVLLGLGSDKLFGAFDSGQEGALGSLGVVKGMAPEIARGVIDLGETLDFYALGVLLFEVIVGKPVFTGRSPADVLAGHMLQTPQNVSDSIEDPIPEALDNFIQKLMAKESSSRPGSIDEIRRMLGDVKRATEEMLARAAQTGTREDIETWADGLIENPGDEEILNELKNEARNSNAWGAAIEVIEEAALSCDDDAIVHNLLLEAADAAVAYVKNYDKAEQIYAQLIEARPDDQVLNIGMLKLLKAKGSFEELVEKLAANAETVEDTDEKMAVIQEIAEIYEQNLQDPDKAFDYYSACLGQGADRNIVNKLEKLAGRTDRFENLAEICGVAVQAAESEGDIDTTVYLYSKLGGWYLENLDQANYALSCFQKVLEHQPANLEALSAVADLYRGAQQWSELAQVIVRIGESETVPSRSRDHLADAAKIYYEKQSETDTAKNLLEGILEEDPAHEGAINLLITILESTEEWEKLSKLMANKINAMPDGEEQVASRHKLGELYEDRIDNLKAAQEQYECALEIDTRHLDCIKGLERIYARTGEMVGLRDNLEIQLEIAVTPKQRIGLMGRLAEMHEEEFKEIDKTIDYFSQILEIENDNMAALVSLTRHYRKTERFEDLVSILQSRADLTESEEEKQGYLSEMAEVLRDDLKDVQRASIVFESVAHLGGDAVLEALFATQVETGNLDAAVGSLQKMFDAVEETNQKVTLLVRIAEFQHSKLEDNADAADTLRRAKDLDPTDSKVLTLLAEIYTDQGNFAGAMDLLEEELKTVEGSHARAEIYAKLGLIALNNLNDDDKAIVHFEHALELDEANLVAGDNISTLFRERNEWSKALPIYERWAAASDVLSLEKQIELFSQMGEAFIHLDRQEDALTYFQKAADIAKEPHLIRRLAEVAYDIGEYEMAKKQLARFVKIAGDKLSGEEKVEIFVLQGNVLLKTKDFSDAAKLARQATVMAPENDDARLLLADVHENRGDFRGAVESRQRVLANISDDDARWRGLIRKTATLLFEKLRDVESASKLLNEALEKHPDDRDILGVLLKMYYASKRYEQVVTVVLKIASLVDDQQQLARYYLTVAKIYRRELKKPDMAIEYFEMAVENDASIAGAGDAIIEILTSKKDWEAIERHYKKLLSKLPKDSTSEEKLEVYVPMADLIINKLDRVKDGILLTEAITKLDPQNKVWLEKLADLYGWEKAYSSKAKSLHQRLLSTNPSRIDSLRTLYRIHSAEESPDKAWSTASILALLNQASPEERKFYKEYQLDSVPAMTSKLKDENWRKDLYHQNMNQNISSIFSVVGSAIFKEKTQKLSKFGLDESKGINVEKSSSKLAKFVNFAVEALDVDAPTMFMNQSFGDKFQMVDTMPPVLIAGKSAEKLKDSRGLAFVLGQQLTLQRSGLYVNKLITSGTELSSWLLAAIKIFVQTLPVPSELAGSVQEKLAPIRDSLNANDMEKLQGYVQSFVSQASDVNLKRWAKSVTYTGDRAGLLLCGDVSVAIRILKEQISDKTILSDRLRELTLFTISDSNSSLRNHLGVSLKND